MQWIKDPSQSNVDNLNSVRDEASRHFRNKKKGYLKAKIEELETNSKIKNIGDLDRGINDFKRRVIWLQTPTVFWLGGGTISLNCCMYVRLMLGRQKYT